jgi:translocon-associated protein subunit beta
LLAATVIAAVGDTHTQFVLTHNKVAISRPGPSVERLAVTLNLYNQGTA